METNIAKCFICDASCTAEEKFLGTNISRTLTMSMTAMLAKCLRSIVDTENEYFCMECTRKLEEYDQVIQLSVQIETELYELFQRKPSEPCYLLDAEIISDQDQINEALIENDNAKIVKEATQIEIHGEEFAESYDEMVVEYLEDYETQSDTAELVNDQNEVGMEDKLVPNNDDDTEIVEEKVLRKTPSPRKTKNKKDNAKNRKGKKSAVQTKTEPSEAIDSDLSCQKCSFIAETREELEEHKTINHIEEIKQLVCDICGRSYKSKSALCVHIGMHNGRNSHECHICGKTFTQRGALVRHMPMHTGERPHQCDVCGKRFIHYSSFHMHQMIHTNERKKKCSICGSEFRSNSHMTRHMRSHTGEKPFACPICGQKFAQRYNMKTHYNTHQGIHRPTNKNHKCLICEEAFPRREKLNSHLRQAHLISDEDITALAENGPDSKITQKIIARLKSSVFTKEEVLVEYINDIPGELISADPLK